jgi:hypothetical protein
MAGETTGGRDEQSLMENCLGDNKWPGKLVVLLEIEANDYKK